MIETEVEFVSNWIYGGYTALLRGAGVRFDGCSACSYPFVCKLKENLEAFYWTERGIELGCKTER